MVLADPGMGKSTLLRMEAGLTAKEERESLENNLKNIEDVTFPLFLKLSELAELTKEVTATVIEAILKLIEGKCGKTLATFKSLLEDKLQTGKCLLLLDALDEVTNEYRNQLSEKLNDFLRNYPCQIICTSRIVGYVGFVNKAQEIEIVPFSQKKIDEYIETWFKNAAVYLNNDSVSASELIRELRNKPQVRGLAQNPLLLSLICCLYQEKGLTLPVQRWKVYEQAVRYMVGKWSKNRNPELDEAWVDAKTELLEEIAYQLSINNQNKFTVRQLRKIIDKYLQRENTSTDFEGKNASYLVTELSEQDGILQKFHEDSNEYIFLHRTFQEYLTASYLNQCRDGIALTKAHFWNYEWHETISLVAGLMRNPVPLLETITREKDDIFGTLMLLAGRCIAASEEIYHPIITEIINKIYEFWCRYPNAGFIQSVVVALGQNHSQMFEKLQTILENEKFRVYAIETLSKIGSFQALKTLITVLNHKDERVRSSVVDALGEIHISQAVEPLVTALNDQEAFVRWRAIEALGKIGSPQAVKALIASLNDQEGYVRMNVPFALGKIDSPQAVEALITALSHEDGSVRWYAESTLGRIGSPQAVKALITALSCRDKRVRWYAVKALSKIGTSQAVKALTTTALSDEEGVIRMNTVEALGKIGTRQALASLISVLKDEDLDVRVSAAEALAKIGTSEAIASLITALSHEDRRIRVRAALALAQIGSYEAVTTLIATLSHEDWCFRSYAVEALDKIGTPEVVQALITALRDEESRVRWRAAEALGKIGTPEVVQALIIALRDKEGFVRWYAAEALAKINSPEVFTALTTALRDEDWRVREGTAMALGQIGSPEAVQGLIKVLCDEKAEVRLNTVLALAKISSPNTVSALIKILGDEDHRVRSNAIEALAKIDTSETLAKLIQQPEIDIYCPDIFLLARKLAVRYTKQLPRREQGESLIPLYPELLKHKKIEIL
nr:HEAT repeat domain-containing protein [Scytonema sp. UIC 10036]